MPSSTLENATNGNFELPRASYEQPVDTRVARFGQSDGAVQIEADHTARIGIDRERAADVHAELARSLRPRTDPRLKQCHSLPVFFADVCQSKVKLVDLDDVIPHRQNLLRGDPGELQRLADSDCLAGKEFRQGILLAKRLHVLRHNLEFLWGGMLPSLSVIHSDSPRRSTR